MNYYDCTYCDDCEYRDECDLVDNVNFCEDCEERWTCDIRGVDCKAGHDIEWECSGDISRETLIERLEKYRKGETANEN